jgi:hypothetical protein
MILLLILLLILPLSMEHEIVPYNNIIDLKNKINNLNSIEYSVEKLKLSIEKYHKTLPVNNIDNINFNCKFIVKSFQHELWDLYPDVPCDDVCHICFSENNQFFRNWLLRP